MTKTTIIKLKKTYYSYLLVIVALMLIAAYIIAKYELADSYAILNSGGVIKTVQMIITLFGIPGVFGLFTKQVESAKFNSDRDKFEKYAKAARLRMTVIAVIFFINAVVYFLISEQSQLIMVAITAFVFLFTRPSENRIISDLGLPNGTDGEEIDQ